MVRVVALALVFSLLGATGSVAQTPTLPTIKIASAPSDDMSPALYADKAGLFRAAGIAVDIQRAASGSAVASAVAAGAIDIGKSSIVPLISAHARGFPFTLIAPSAIYTHESRAAAVITLKNAPYKSARDLNGKTVSVAGLQDLNWLGVQAWIDQNGGDIKTIKFIEVPVTSVATALDTGRIEAGAMQNPVLAQDLESGKYRVLGLMDDAISHRFLQSAWFTTQSYASKNADLVARFVRVMKQAGEYTNAHPDETIDMLASFTGMEASTIRKMPRVLAGTTINVREIQPLIDAAVKYKLIDKPFPATDFISQFR